MEDKVFGTLEVLDVYNLLGCTTLSFFGKDTEVDVVIFSDEDSKISAYQYECYEKFLSKWGRIELDVLGKLLDDYNDFCEIAIECDESYEDYPMFSSVWDLEDKISLNEVTVVEEYYIEQYMRSPGKERCIILRFTCSWDEGKERAVVLINEKVYATGQIDDLY